MDSSTNLDNPLQIETSVNPWALNEPEPTTLLALYPGVQAPTLEAIAKTASVYLTEPLNIVKQLEPDDPKIIFNAVVELPFLKQPAVIFAEPAQPLSPQELDDAAANECKWVIGIETLFDTCDAHLNFVELMRFLAKLITNCPAILDVNCGRWFPREAIEKQFFTQIDEVIIDPPEDVLWLIHAIGQEETATVWVHTHGLLRCGNPELEMLQVPIDQVTQSCELINTIAGRLLEERPPEPGCDMQIGPHMNVTLQPWQKIAPLLAENIPGCMTDRIDEPDNPHIGLRAVICSDKSQECNTYPVDVIEKMSRDDAVLFPAIRVADRLADLARATWPLLVHEFNTLPKQLLRTDIHPMTSDDQQAVCFVIKASLSLSYESTESPEHLWFVVHQFEGNRVQAQLMNDPVQNHEFSEGDTTWISRETISDWSVITPNASYGPSQLEELAAALSELKQGIAT